MEMEAGKKTKKKPEIMTETEAEAARCVYSQGETCANCHTKHTPRSEQQNKLLQNRISRMVGQLNGISRMLEENRYCGDVLMQVAAVESALQNFGYVILKEHMETCVVEEVRNGNDKIMDEAFELVRKLK